MAVAGAQRQLRVCIEQLQICCFDQHIAWWLAPTSTHFNDDNSIAQHDFRDTIAVQGLQPADYKCDFCALKNRRSAFFGFDDLRSPIQRPWDSNSTSYSPPASGSEPTQRPDA